MAPACGVDCLRCTIVVLSAVYFVTGAALVAVGAVVEARSPAIYAVAIFTIITGIIILSISFIGVCGALRQSRILVTIYGSLVVLAFVMTLAIFIIGMIFVAKSNRFGRDYLYDCIAKYSISQPNRQYVNHVQEINNCCGSESYHDWWMSTAFRRAKSVPDSCCKAENRTANCGAGGLQNPDIINTQGCFQSVGDFIRTQNLILGISAIIITAALVVGIVFVFRLANALDSGHGYISV